MNDFIDKFSAVPLGQRVLGLLFLMIVIVLASYFVLLEPVYAETTAANARMQQLQREKESLDQLKRNRKLVLAQLEKLKRRLLIAQEKLPKDAEIPSLLQRIHNQAKTAGLEIEKFERRQDVPKDFYVEIPVVMELSGTYDELANFLYYIGRMTRIVNVKNLSLKRESTGVSPDGNLTVTAAATTFRYKSEGELGAGGKKQKKRK